MTTIRIKRFVLFPKTPALVIGWYRGGFLFYVPFLFMFNSSAAAPLIMLSPERYFYLQISRNLVNMQLLKWRKTFFHQDVLFGKKKREFVYTDEEITIKNADGEWILRPCYKYDYRPRLPWKKENVVNGLALVKSPIPLPPQLTFVATTIPIDAVIAFTESPGVLATLKDCMDNLASISNKIPSLV